MEVKTVSGLRRGIQLLLLLLVWSTTNANYLDRTCRTPNGEDGQCRSLRSCEPIRNLLIRRRSTITTHYLRLSECGWQDHRPLVCCPSSGSASDDVRDLPPISNRRRRTTEEGDEETEVRERVNDLSNHPNWSLMSMDVCGSDDTDRIFGGEEANLKEYPWLALLEYQTLFGRKFLCGGSLINNRYVLTAAHCVAGLDSMTLVNVRLGEHNTETDPDCKDYDDERICAEPAQDFNVSEVIIHPQYQTRSRNKHHDIALIRLDREVSFAEHINPICLPSAAAVNKLYESESMVVAGWGKTENRSSSPVKLWVRLPVMGHGACQQVYRRELTLIANQMCAGGEAGKDSCQGDSGGPLMAMDTVPGRRGGVWTVGGVLSMGPYFCGTPGQPGIYTRVGPYLQWILDNVKA